jgi:uncharacterized membrane protein (DUF373 family)
MVRAAAPDGPMLDLVKKLEHWITLVLVGMLAVVVLLATVELGVTIFKDIVTPPLLFPGIDRLLDIFGRLLLVLIGIELLETIRAFAAKGIVRVEIVLTVAIIALCRKVILIEIGRVTSAEMAGLAMLLAALGLLYWALGRGRRDRGGMDSPRPLIRGRPHL